MRQRAIDTAEIIMRSLPAAFGILLLLGAAPARASIRIDDASYENGKLTVTGQATPNQAVMLDGKYKTKSDGGGHFEFHESYKPQSCMSDITAGDDSYSTIITNCLLDDAAAALTPAAKAPLPAAPPAK
jgi:hypothetical protein